MKYLALAIILSLACQSSLVLAWSSHSLGTALALTELPAFKSAPLVQVESLESFLEEGGVVLQQLLDEQEVFFRENLPGYPARPDDLRWMPSQSGHRRRAFLMALRINPEIKLAYFVQALHCRNWGDRPFIEAADVLVFRQLDQWHQWHFQRVALGEKLPALAVVASAAAEPDYGHDINLFSDNPGEAGARYNFGTQPFGDARFEYSSQAPFHIGYYHEDEIIYRAAPFLARTYPEMRAHQYLGLARFAFESGHPYWGYRFLGWGLHYIQDLTQPYHAKALPGQSTSHMIWVALKAMMGFGSDKKVAITQVADRHTEVERYQADLARQLLCHEYGSQALLRAYTDSRSDGDYPPFDGESLRQVVSKEAYDAADDFDTRVMLWLADGDVDRSLRHRPQNEPLNQALIRLIRHFGAHTRNVSRSVLP